MNNFEFIKHPRRKTIVGKSQRNEVKRKKTKKISPPNVFLLKKKNSTIIQGNN